MIGEFIDHSGVDNSNLFLSKGDDILAKGLGWIFGGEGTVPVVITGNSISEGLLSEDVIGG